MGPDLLVIGEAWTIGNSLYIDLGLRPDERLIRKPREFERFVRGRNLFQLIGPDGDQIRVRPGRPAWVIEWSNSKGTAPDRWPSTMRTVSGGTYITVWVTAMYRTDSDLKAGDYEIRFMAPHSDLLGLTHEASTTIDIKMVP